MGIAVSRTHGLRPMDIAKSPLVQVQCLPLMREYKDHQLHLWLTDDCNVRLWPYREPLG